MEKVLVVPSNLVGPFLGSRSFITDKIPEFIQMVIDNHIYVDRDYAEYAKEYKQIIPYAILRNGDKVFLTQRLKKQTEKFGIKPEEALVVTLDAEGQFFCQPIEKE